MVLFFLKSISALWGKSKKGEVIGLYYFFLPKLLLLGAVYSALFIIFRGPGAIFLNQPDTLPLTVASVMFIISGVGVLNNAVINGILAFKLLALNSIIEITFKLVTSLIFVFSGMGLIGAILGYMSAGISRITCQFIEFNHLFKGRKVKKYNFNKNQLIIFIPIVATTLILSSFINADIIMVKHFFDPLTAGNYVALSTVGKIILYALGPVITVMFPIISIRKSGGFPYILPLVGSLLISVSISLVILMLFYLLPDFIVNILFGKKYTLVVPNLTHFSFFIALHSLNYLITYFLLSVSQYRSLIYLFIIAVFQWLLLGLFHNSITQVINVNLAVSAVYFLFAFYFFLLKEFSGLLLLYKKFHTRVFIND